MGVPGFWDEPEAAGRVGAEHARLNRRLDTFTKLQADADDLEGLVELAEEDEELAAELEETLVSVEERLAACVNLVPGVRSIYRWQDAVEQADEVLMVIKTTAANVDALTARVGQLHPYEVPEVIALEATDISDAYMAWLEGGVR